MASHSQNPKRRGGTPHVGRFLWPVIKPAMRRRGFFDRTLIEHWPAIVGEALAAFSQPMRLSRGGGGRDGSDASGGVLTVKVEGAMALELQHLAPQIIDRLNSYYGHAAIARLNIVQGPIHHRPRPDITPSLTAEEIRAEAETMSDIATPRLRQALARLSLRLKKKHE